MKSLPSCTAPKYQPDGTSYAIDQRIRALLQEGLSIYRVDPARLKALRPDVVLTQDQCEVCAATLEQVEEAVCALLDPAPLVVSLRPTDLESIWSQIVHLGGIFSVPDRARRLAQCAREELEAIDERSADRRGTPSVVIVEWLDPLMSAGNWIPELVELAGGQPLFGGAGAHSPWLEWDDLVSVDPEVLIVTPCGYQLPRTLAELGTLTGRPGWADLRAVREQRVFVADGNAYFNRSGPRIVDSARILGEMIHPDLFGQDHRGCAWLPWVH